MNKLVELQENFKLVRENENEKETEQALTILLSQKFKII